MYVNIASNLITLYTKLLARFSLQYWIKVWFRNKKCDVLATRFGPEIMTTFAFTPVGHLKNVYK